MERGAVESGAERRTDGKRTDGVEEWLERCVWPATKPEFQEKPVTKEEMDALWE
jgi:hypothetical protein